MTAPSLPLEDRRLRIVRQVTGRLPRDCHQLAHRVTGLPIAIPVREATGSGCFTATPDRFLPDSAAFIGHDAAHNPVLVCFDLGSTADDAVRINCLSAFPRSGGVRSPS